MWRSWSSRSGGSARFLLLAVAVSVIWSSPSLGGGQAGAGLDPDSTVLAEVARSMGELPGFTSVAVRDDATALFANPAGIDRSIPLGYYLSWDSGLHGRGDVGTIGLTAGPLGFGYQQVRPPRSARFGRTTFALGGGSRLPVSFGVRGSREHQERVGPDESAWRWDMGLLWRPSRVLSFGALARDLNQGRMFDQLYLRSYVVGLGIRPIPLRDPSRFTLFAEIALLWGRAAGLEGSRPPRRRRHRGTSPRRGALRFGGGRKSGRLLG